MAPDSATFDSRLSRLLAEWRAMRAGGRTPIPEELCRECPELVDEFRQVLQESGAAVESLTTAFDSTLLKPSRRDAPPWPGVPGFEPLDQGLMGGMGVVYRVRDLNLDRVVGVKVLRSGSFASDDQIQRFLDEGRTLAKLDHPNVVRVHGFNYHQGQPYFAMEWVGGGGLHQHIPRLQADPKESARVMERIARAVHYLHENRIWHRDLKPANILLDERDEPKISDFGLAKLLEEDGDATQSRAAVGTLAYMAPEQFKVGDSRPNRQTDIWSLGVTLFEMLTGKRPFVGDSELELSSSIQKEKPPSLRSLRPELDRGLEIIINKCLEKDPRDRYSSAEALADDLAKWQRGEPIWPEPNWKKAVRWTTRHPRRVGSWFAFLVVLVFACVAAYYAIRSSPLPPPEDPDRALKAMKADLLAGKTVTVIQKGQPPAWMRWRLGEGKGSTHINKENYFQLDTRELAVLELFDELPIERFRIQGRLLQSEGGDFASTGVLFALQSFANDRTNLTVFFEFSFTDVGEQVKILTKRAGKPTGIMDAQIRFYLDPAASPQTYPTTSSYVREQIPTGVGTGLWRAFAVDVTPEALVFWLDGKKVGAITLQDFQPQASLLVDKYQKVFPVKPAWRFHQGIGIFCNDASASFEFLTIGPIPEQ